MNFLDLRNYLHRNCDGYWYLWTLEGKQSIWAKIGEELPIPNSHSNVFFGVNPSRSAKSPAERTKITDIACINALYAEFDAKDYGSMDKAADRIRSLPIKATVVNHSGGGWHAYYFLKDTFQIETDDDLERARRLQAAWVEYTKSDKGAKDLARVLRVPGTINWKPQYAPDFPKVRIVFSDLTRLYSIEKLESIIPKPKPRPEPREQHFGKGYVEAALQNETQRVMCARDGERNSTLNVAAYSLRKLIGNNGLSRSRVEGALLCAALGAGLPEREAERTIRSGLDGAGK